MESNKTPVREIPERRLNDGGPAFPSERRLIDYPILADDGKTIIGRKGDIDGPPGMSLRDYFAAHVTEKEIAEIMFEHIIKGDILDLGPVNYLITRQQARYIHADAMLEARDGK